MNIAVNGHIYEQERLRLIYRRLPHDDFTVRIDGGEAARRTGLIGMQFSRQELQSIADLMSLNGFKSTDIERGR